MGGHWEWDETKFQINTPLWASSARPSPGGSAASTTELKAKTTELNTLKGAIDGAKRKTQGNLQVKALTEVVNPANDLVNSEELVTLLVCVPKTNTKEFEEGAPARARDALTHAHIHHLPHPHPHSTSPPTASLPLLCSYSNFSATYKHASGDEKTYKYVMPNSAKLLETDAECAPPRLSHALAPSRPLARHPRARGSLTPTRASPDTPPGTRCTGWCSLRKFEDDFKATAREKRLNVREYTAEPGAKEADAKKMSDDEAEAAQQEGLLTNWCSINFTAECYGMLMHRRRCASSSSRCSRYGLTAATYGGGGSSPTSPRTCSSPSAARRRRCARRSTRSTAAARRTRGWTRRRPSSPAPASASSSRRERRSRDGADQRAMMRGAQGCGLYCEWISKILSTRGRLRRKLHADRLRRFLDSGINLQALLPQRRARLVAPARRRLQLVGEHRRRSVRDGRLELAPPSARRVGGARAPPRRAPRSAPPPPRARGRARQPSRRRAARPARGGLGRRRRIVYGVIDAGRHPFDGHDFAPPALARLRWWRTSNAAESSARRRLSQLHTCGRSSGLKR